jgi:rubrerythrin
MKTINFATLSLQDALDFAILIEEEAAERYQELVDQMEAHHTPGAATFFRFMVENETKHGSALAARRRTLFGDAPCNVDRSELWEVEAPEYEKGRAFMTARQALEVALESEQKAHDFFAATVPHVADAKARALFEELREEELEHRELVKKELAKLPEDQAVDMDDYVDEPVGQ